jgi:TolB-like protein
MLVIVAGIVLFSSRKETPVVPRKKSMLVVLPFDNLGSAEDEYFADGLSEEITSRLAALHGLGVISRTSAVFYKKTNKSIKEIGAELNVDYGLTGTVRWDRKPGGQDRVRVTPQLIRVSDDTQLWSESYDRVLQDLFSVQTNIAEQVVKQLDIAVLEPERRALEAKPTNNLEAYDFYLRAIEAYNQAYITSDRKKHEKTIELLERATQLDPNFIFAIILLSRVHTRMYLVGIDRTEERLAKATEALNRALELEPDLPEVQLALAYYYLQGLQDNERALKIFESVKRARPNIPPSFLASIQRNQGKWEKAIINYEAAFRLSPRSSDIAHSLARCYAWIGQYEESEKWFDRAISIFPDLYYSKLGKARLPFLARGDTKESRTRLEALPPHRLTDYNFYLLGLLERNYEEVLDLLARTPYDYFGEVNFYIPRDLACASVYHAMNKDSLTKKYAELARQELEKNITENPEDARFHASLGLAYAYLDRKQEAIREGQKAVELYPISKDAFDGTLGIWNLATIYTVVGEFDEALKELGYLLSIPCGNYFSVSMMRLDPTWDPLRQDPRFKRLLEENSKGPRFRIDPKKLAAAWD